MKVDRLVRFALDATQDDRRAFGRRLLNALDRIGVRPGEEFVIAAPEHAAELTGNGSGNGSIYDPDSSTIGPFARDSETSRQAAILNYPRRHTQRWHVLMAVYYAGPRGKTRDELVVELELPPNVLTPRVKELLTGGRIEETEETRPTRRGGDAVVLKITERGVEEVARHDPDLALSR